MTPSMKECLNKYIEWYGLPLSAKYTHNDRQICLSLWATTGIVMMVATRDMLLD